MFDALVAIVELLSSEMFTLELQPFDVQLMVYDLPTIQELELVGLVIAMQFNEALNVKFRRAIAIIVPEDDVPRVSIGHVERSRTSI